MSNQTKNRQHNRMRSFSKTFFLILVLISLQPSVYANENPTAALGAHLQEMKLHMTQMHSMLEAGTVCKELERHMKQMTMHMEMMMEMMENMHKRKSEHEMNHE